MSAATETPAAHPLAGMAWAVFAVLTASILLALPKWVGGGLSPIQVTLLRYLTGFLTIAPFFLYATAMRREEAPRAEAAGTMKLHALRAFLAVIRISCFFYAVTHMPFANAQAITLTNGVFMILFAALLLGERVRPGTIVAAVFCFAGGVIAAEPNLDGGGFLSLGALAALAGAVMWGVEAAVIKYTAVRDNTARIIFSVNLIALLLVAVPGLAVWTPLSLEQWLPLILIGPLAIITQVSNVKAFRLADANFLAPFRYASVVFALAIGWLVFGEWPTMAGGIGIMMILISGVALTITSGGFPRRLA